MRLTTDIRIQVSAVEIGLKPPYLSSKLLAAFSTTLNITVTANRKHDRSQREPTGVTSELDGLLRQPVIQKCHHGNEC